MRTSDSDDEPAVLLAHAWRLSEPALVHHGPTPLDGDLHLSSHEVGRLAGLLRREKPGLAFEDAFRWARRALHETEWWDSLRRLAERCVRFEAGRPAASIGVLEDRLRRLVQADALVCWRLARLGWSPFEPGAASRLDWSATLPPERSEFDPVLGRSTAENHCHLGSTMSTAAMWVFALCGDGPVDGLFPGMAGTPNQEVWHRCLNRARRAALYLGTATRPGSAFVDEPATAEARDGVDLLALRRLLFSFVPQQLQATPERPTPPWRMTSTELDIEVLRWPLGEWVIAGKASLSVLAGERLLVWRALRLLALADAGPRRDAVRKVGSALLAYLRIKNGFHQALILGKYGRGFFAFDRTFKRRSFYFSPAAGTGPARSQMCEALERRRVALAIDGFLEDALGHGRSATLASWPRMDLELRVSPGAGPSFVRTLRGWLRGARDAMERWRTPPLRIGFVLHSVKTGSPTWWDDVCVRMDGLRYLMDDRPGLCRLLVGIDVCGVERDRPPRQCADLFREVRSFVDRQDPATSAFPWRPGFTVHVGEDFPDLLTGLRHVDEAAHLLGLRPNDRLGHALALGWDIDAFYKSAQSPGLSLRERLLDLLWLLYLTTESGGELREEAFWLRREAMDLVSKWGSPAEGADPGSLVDTAVDRTGAHFRGSSFRGEAELLRMLGIPLARWEEELPVPVLDHDHRRCVHAARRVVWQRVHNKGLFIESNPTSNLIIGGFEAYTDLPVVRQGRAPGLAAGADVPALRVTINTDNPGIFDTTLRNEYVRVGKALLARPDGVDAVQVSEWLDRVRENGLAASFIPGDVPRGADFVRLLGKVIGDEELAARPS
ncbi:MAG TPA: hypothetical protein VGG06_22660 [Thermoanaerobaculia bacterium]